MARRGAREGRRVAQGRVRLAPVGSEETIASACLSFLSSLNLHNWMWCTIGALHVQSGWLARARQGSQAPTPHWRRVWFAGRMRSGARAARLHRNEQWTRRGRYRLAHCTCPGMLDPGTSPVRRDATRALPRAASRPGTAKKRKSCRPYWKLPCKRHNEGSNQPEPLTLLRASWVRRAADWWGVARARLAGLRVPEMMGGMVRCRLDGCI